MLFLIIRGVFAIKYSFVAKLDEHDMIIYNSCIENSVFVFVIYSSSLFSINTNDFADISKGSL